MNAIHIIANKILGGKAERIRKSNVQTSKKVQYLIEGKKTIWGICFISFVNIVKKEKRQTWNNELKCKANFELGHFVWIIYFVWDK